MSKPNTVREDITKDPMYNNIFLANAKCNDVKSLGPLVDLFNQAIQATEERVRGEVLEEAEEYKLELDHPAIGDGEFAVGWIKGQDHIIGVMDQSLKEVKQ